MRDPMKLDKAIPVQFGKITGSIFGGPFRQYQPGTRRLVGVKMAKEIDHPHDFKVDTEDFSVPSMDAMREGIMFGLEALSKGNDLYVGCMGGIGRTGLYMACMAKVMADYARVAGTPPPLPSGPVAFVRAHYKAHAVETDEQQAFVGKFLTKEAIDWLRIENNIAPPVVKYVDKIVYQSPLQWVKNAVKAAFTPAP